MGSKFYKTSSDGSFEWEVGFNDVLSFTPLLNVPDPVKTNLTSLPLVGVNEADTLADPNESSGPTIVILPVCGVAEEEPSPTIAGSIEDDIVADAPPYVPSRILTTVNFEPCFKYSFAVYEVRY